MIRILCRMDLSQDCIITVLALAKNKSVNLSVFPATKRLRWLILFGELYFYPQPNISHLTYASTLTNHVASFVFNF